MVQIEGRNLEVTVRESLIDVEKLSYSAEFDAMLS